MTYLDGYRAGYADGLVGIQSEYAWFATSFEEKLWAYSRGYRCGWQDAIEHREPRL